MLVTSAEFHRAHEAHHATDFFEDDIGEKFFNGFIPSRHTVQEKIPLEVPR